MSKFEELDFAMEAAKEAGLRAFTVPLDDCMKEVGEWHTARMNEIHRLSATGGVVRVQLKAGDKPEPPKSQLEIALEEKAAVEPEPVVEEEFGPAPIFPPKPPADDLYLPEDEKPI